MVGQNRNEYHDDEICCNIYIYIYIYIYSIVTVLVVTIPLFRFVAHQIQYNMESAQYLC